VKISFSKIFKYLAPGPRTFKMQLFSNFSY
jgi:hypothetical protein